jgi:hypothetical protein
MIMLAHCGFAGNLRFHAFHCVWASSRCSIWFPPVTDARACHHCQGQQWECHKRPAGYQQVIKRDTKICPALRSLQMSNVLKDEVVTCQYRQERAHPAICLKRACFFSLPFPFGFCGALLKLTRTKSDAAATSGTAVHDASSVAETASASVAVGAHETAAWSQGTNDHYCC